MSPAPATPALARGLTRGGAAVLAVLFLATLAAFVVNQRLKQAPSLVRAVRVSPLLTPDGDRTRDLARIAFTPGGRGPVRARIVDGAGRPVRTLDPLPKLPCCPRREHFRWDGSTDAGTAAPEGEYRVEVPLRRGDRVLELRRAIRLGR